MYGKSKKVVESHMRAKVGTVRVSQVSVIYILEPKIINLSQASKVCTTPSKRKTSLQKNGKRRYRVDKSSIVK